MPHDSLTPAPAAVEGRRGFLRRAGLGLGVVATAGLVQGCDVGEVVDPPPEGVLRGIVVDPDGDPVEGATVSIDGTSLTTTTGENGGYRFESVPEGQYTVTVAAFDTLGSGAIGDADTLNTISADVNIVRGGTGYTQNFDFADGLDAVTFDFSSDIGVLNYALALEQLEAGFYAVVVADAAFATTFDEAEQAILQDLAAHEAIHRDFLTTAIQNAGGTPVSGIKLKFTGIDFADRGDVLATAQTFEDLGVAAYNGAGQYLTDPNLLTIAGKIVSVEARHASVVSGLIADNEISGGVIDGDGLDQALSPDDVLDAVDPFVYNLVSASNVASA